MDIWYIRRKNFYSSIKKPLKRNIPCDWYPFVKIDLRKCPDLRVIDLSTEEELGKVFDPVPHHVKNFAIDANEVILLGKIPEEAIERYQISITASDGQRGTHQGQHFGRGSGSRCSE